ncbi:MAG: ferrous iron transport protein A [Chloroflexi bacterium]|nr:ferrous iron transport protein A [Chloroflexota bacterium]
MRASIGIERYLAKEGTRRLADLGPGDRAMIVKVHGEEPKMLQYLASLGLFPTVEIAIQEVAPFHGPLLIQVGRARYALGREVASKILVRELDD